jgi:hypothetical protein
MPPPLRSPELCNGSSLGPEMATIQVISVLILVLGFDVFHIHYPIPEIWGEVPEKPSNL